MQDAEGNLTLRSAKDGSGSQEFGWDYRNRLTQVITKDSEGNVTLTATYEYDAFDRRIRRTLGGSTTLDEQYLYDGTGDADVALVLDGSGNVKLRQLNAPGSNQVLAEDRCDGQTVTTRWALADHEGSVRDVVDNSGTVVDHIQYDSFGNIVAQTQPTERTREAYTGAPKDAETGFVYLHHRYMDASAGRWISQDPIRFAAGDGNLYRYASNSPLDGTDVTGLLRDAYDPYGLGSYIGGNPFDPSQPHAWLPDVGDSAVAAPVVTSPTSQQLAFARSRINDAIDAMLEADEPRLRQLGRNLSEMNQSGQIVPADLGCYHNTSIWPFDSRGTMGNTPKFDWNNRHDQRIEVDVEYAQVADAIALAGVMAHEYNHLMNLYPRCEGTLGQIGWHIVEGAKNLIPFGKDLEGNWVGAHEAPAWDDQRWVLRLLRVQAARRAAAARAGAAAESKP